MLAILFWGTTIAFSRSLTEKLGPLTAASWIYLISGTLGILYLLVFPQERRKVFKLPGIYLWGCGLLFLIYTVLLYLAIGLAFNREQVMEVSIINYLWPGLTLLFSLPILHKKGKLTLIPGIILAFAGIYLVTLQSGIFSWDVFKGNFQINYLPYLLAFGAAICWGLYSNLSRYWAGHSQGQAVPLFLFFTGIALLAIRFYFLEESNWSFSVVLELLYMSIFPTFLAYSFWDRAMREGKMVLVASFSYFTPLLSILITSYYLQIKIQTNIWIACLLVITGALLSKISIVEEKEEKS
ncbi:MAG: aromatic amino acid DMT transporter YddG [Candidatus Caldatribacteriota bacterium]